MTRIPQITDRDDVTPEGREVFDAIVASRGGVRGPFTVLMHSPEVAGRVAHLGSFVRFESSLPSHLREAAATTVVRERDCAYEWAMHVNNAPEAGVSAATMSVIRDKAALDGLPVDEQAVIRYTRELVREHHVSQATFERAQAILGDRGITELTAAIGYYCMIACVLNAFEVPAPAGGSPLP
jgi:4-carboxymuconolactone decarboxylase